MGPGGFHGFFCTRGNSQPQNQRLSTNFSPNSQIIWTRGGFRVFRGVPGSTPHMAKNPPPKGGENLTFILGLFRIFLNKPGGPGAFVSKKTPGGKFPKFREGPL